MIEDFPIKAGLIIVTVVKGFLAWLAKSAAPLVNKTVLTGKGLTVQNAALYVRSAETIRWQTGQKDELKGAGFAQSKARQGEHLRVLDKFQVKLQPCSKNALQTAQITPFVAAHGSLKIVPLGVVQLIL